MHIVHLGFRWNKEKVKDSSIPYLWARVSSFSNPGSSKITMFSGQATKSPSTNAANPKIQSCHKRKSMSISNYLEHHTALAQHTARPAWWGQRDAAKQSYPFQHRMDSSSSFILIEVMLWSHRPSTSTTRILSKLSMPTPQRKSVFGSIWFLWTASMRGKVNDVESILCHRQSCHRSRLRNL